MKVLQVHNRYRQPGGEDVVVEAEAELLRQGGHEVSTYSVSNPNDPVRAAGRLAIAPWNPIAARRMLRFVDEVNPDVAHVHNTWFSLSSSVLAALSDRGIPMVMTLHNYRFMCCNALLYRDGGPCDLCVGRHPWPGIRYRCYRDSLPASAVAAASIEIGARRRTWERNVGLFLALTHSMKELFTAAGLDADKIRVKPNFVPDPGLRNRPPSTSDTVLFVGRLSPEKGLQTLLEAWRRSVPRSLQLVVIGDGPQRGDLERSRPERVRFLGPQSREAVTRQMLDARALAFPSKWLEGLPMVLLEAFAAGLPVLGSDLGSTREVLAPIGDWRVTPGDVDAWGDALSRVSEDEAVDAASGAVRHTYVTDYTPDVALARLEEAYRAVIR